MAAAKPRAARKSLRKRAAPKKAKPKPRKKVGRPTKYLPEYCTIAQRMCLKGALDREVAHTLGVSESTLNLWKLEHQEFSEAMRLGKEGPDIRAEAALFHRAIGYSHESEKILVVNGRIRRVPFTEHYPPSEVAIKFWLQNRRGAIWREVFRQEIANPPGETLKTEQTYVPGSPELLQDYYAKLAAAAVRADPQAPRDLGRAGPPGDEPDFDPDAGPR